MNDQSTVIKNSRVIQSVDLSCKSLHFVIGIAQKSTSAHDLKTRKTYFLDFLSHLISSRSSLISSLLSSTKNYSFVRPIKSSETDCQEKQQTRENKKPNISLISAKQSNRNRINQTDNTA